jgi:carboxymethylenebutenolidase
MVSRTVLIAAVIVVLLAVGGYMYLLKNSLTSAFVSTPATGGSSVSTSTPASPAEFNITTKDVTYFDNTSGYLAKPALSGNYPGVIMIHEWWGLTENIKTKARQLAAEGYTVLAVDLFNGEIATTSERATQLVSSLDQNKALENMRSAIAYLRTNEKINKVASVGWCFGGGQSLQLALSGERLDATVIYYEQPVTDESKLSSIKWPVLGIFGDKDTSIPVSKVKEFSSILDKLGIKNEIHIYPGVGHAFAIPSNPNYAPKEAADAWEKTRVFLNKYLK